MIFAVTLAAVLSVQQLRGQFVESQDGAVQAEALKQIARTPPQDLRDVQSLYDLFVRYTAESVREAALSSLQQLDPRLMDAGPLFVACLRDEEPASVLFGIKGALRLRYPEALPILRKLAKRKFKYPSPGQAPTNGERNEWWIEYNALAALAEWEKERTLPLLRRQAGKVPYLGQLLGRYYWKETLSSLRGWAAGQAEDRARAFNALDAQPPVAELRETRSLMLELVRDPKADPELRRHLAAKVGFCSDAAEVGALLKEHDAASDPALKKLIALAAFASRDDQIVPLLTRYAKEDPQPGVRIGARVQLKDMLPATDYRALLKWAAENDPDPESRDLAKKELL